MKLDVRTPIGAMFVLDGAVLAIYGGVVDQTDAIRKAGGNVTLIWGLVLLAFGATMLGLAVRSYRAK
jgi:tellurite resistance protein TehA-like permease